MTYPEGIGPEYLMLLRRCEEIMTTIESMRQSGNADAKEIAFLRQELSRTMDKMTAMLPALKT